MGSTAIDSPHTLTLLPALGAGRFGFRKDMNALKMNGLCMLMLLPALRAGRFGFQKDMNALKSLRTPHAEENMDAVSLLNATQEIVDRFKIVWRWWRVWREDVRAGWVTIGRFKVWT